MNVATLEKAPETVSINDIASVLFKLPAEQIAMVYDFVLFLQARHGQPVDVSDIWTEEDLTELREASLQYASATILSNEQEVHRCIFTAKLCVDLPHTS